MTNNVEELLREGIDRLAASTTAATYAGARPPCPPGPPARPPPAPGHRRRDHRGDRRRDSRCYGRDHGRPGQQPGLHGQTITYVATRAEQALARLNQSKAIELDTITTRNGAFGFTVMNTAFNGTTGSPSPTVLGSVHASSEVDWTYKRALQRATPPPGSWSTPHHRGAGILRRRLPGPRTLAQPANRPSSGPARRKSRSQLRQRGLRLSQLETEPRQGPGLHRFTLGGNQLVDGIETIRLVGKPVTAEGETFRQTLWVDPKTTCPCGSPRSPRPTGPAH